MNINNMQIQLKRDEIIMKLLQDGVNATSYEVSNRLTEFFDRKPPGLPYFIPIQIKAHDCSDSTSYNEMFKDLGVDLDVLYKTSVNQNNNILVMEEYYEAEKLKVQSYIDNLELRLDNLQDTVKSLKVSQNYCQVFDNFYNIDFVGDPQRNIPGTSAFVDLLQKKVYSDKLSLVSDKYDISNAAITISDLTTNSSINETGSINTILTDSVNDFYIHSANTTTDGKYGMSLQVTLNDVVNASSIMLKLSSSNTVTATLSCSKDGVIYSDIYSIEGTSFLEWNFENTTIQYLKITLFKSESDAWDGSEYQYYYVLKNLSITNETFLGKSVYVSQPIEFTDAIDTLTLTTNELIFPNTDLFYYIGLDNGVDKVNWENIVPGESFDLSILDSKTKIVNNKDTNFGQPLNHGLYSIYQLPDNVNPNTIELTSGYQMWYLESIPLNQPNYILNVNDYNRSKITYSTHVDADIYKLTLNKGCFCVMTQHVYCDNETVLNNKWIKADIENTDSYLQTMIIVNNNKVTPVVNANAIRLKKGRNKIQLLMYVSTDWTAPTFNIKHNINFKEYSFDTFSELPMKHISYYNLVYKTPNVNISTVPMLSTNFAVDINNRIAIRNCPTTSVNSINGNVGIRYFLKYKTLSKRAAKKVTKENGNLLVRFRVMASLLSSEEDMSPQIISYRIVGV